MKGLALSIILVYNVPKWVTMLPIWYISGVSDTCEYIMKVIWKGILFEFSKSHADATSQVSAWLAEAEEAEWSTPNDIKARYVHASFLSDNRVVFNIKGKKYRIDTKINYQHQIVIVKRIGTHADYNKWKF